MRKLAVLLFSIFIIASLTGMATAQEKPAIKIATLNEKGNTVEFALTSPRKFIFANNRYVLHIGDKSFMQYRQSYDYDKKVGSLTFLIPKNDFDNLEDGLGIYLTYGQADETEQDLEELSKHDFPTCWPLGKFSKDLLNK